MRPLLLFSLLFVFSGFSETKNHDFHVSICFCELKPENNDFECYLKVFKDDLEMLKIEPNREMNEEQLLKTYFKAIDDQKHLQLNFIGQETETELEYLYFELKYDKLPPSLMVENTFFFGMFKDQSNIVTLKIDDKIYSKHLSYYNRYATFKITE